MTTTKKCQLNWAKFEPTSLIAMKFQPMDLIAMKQKVQQDIVLHQHF